MHAHRCWSWLDTCASCVTWPCTEYFITSPHVRAACAHQHHTQPACMWRVGSLINWICTRSRVCFCFLIVLTHCTAMLAAVVLVAMLAAANAHSMSIVRYALAATDGVSSVPAQPPAARHLERDLCAVHRLRPQHAYATWHTGDMSDMKSLQPPAASAAPRSRRLPCSRARSSRWSSKRRVPYKQMRALQLTVTRRTSTTSTPPTPSVHTMCMC